jgi:coenzyme F420-dependent glucose-6-phosphate dehydrogenase
MTIRFGYRAVEEQYEPSELLDFAVLAKKQGFEFVCVSDYFYPRFHKGGSAEHAWI